MDENIISCWHQLASNPLPLISSNHSSGSTATSSFTRFSLMIHKTLCLLIANLYINGIISLDTTVKLPKFTYSTNIVFFSSNHSRQSSSSFKKLDPIDETLVIGNWLQRRERGPTVHRGGSMAGIVFNTSSSNSSKLFMMISIDLNAFSHSIFIKLRNVSVRWVVLMKLGRFLRWKFFNLGIHSISVSRCPLLRSLSPTYIKW